MRNQILILSVLFTLLVSMPSVLSFGITPGATEVQFTPGLEQNYRFTVVNMNHEQVRLIVYAQGELNQSIQLLSPEGTTVPYYELELTPSDESKSIEYKVNLPSDMTPGTHKSEIVVLQLPSTSPTGQAHVGAVVGVASQFIVYVPYPGKYAEAELNIINAEKDGEARFIMPITNKGSNDLVRVHANIDIYNKLDEKVASLNVGDISISSGQRKELVGSWKAEVPVGAYRASVTIIYDEKTLTLEGTFNVGSSVLELQQITAPNFRLGEIAKFEMLVENKWSEPISGAYAQTKVYDANSQVIADFKSPTYDISPLTKTVMISYWDTGGVQEGDYNAEIYLKYADKSLQNKVEFKIADDSIQVVGLGYVISESSGSSGSSSNLVTILIVAVVVLVLLNVTWFLMLRRKFVSKPS